MASLAQLRSRRKQVEYEEEALVEDEEEEEGSDVVERGKRKTEIER